MSSSGLDYRLLVFVGHTTKPGARSGVQRVLVESAAALATRVPVDYVTWDRLQGQLRYLDSAELGLLFRGDLDPPEPNSRCRRSNARFGDEFLDPTCVWLVFPEIPYHLEDGNAIFDRIITQCHYLGVSVATVLYDLIPLRDEAYAAAARDHLTYIKSLARSDLILPISRFAGADLGAYLNEVVDLTQGQRDSLQKRIRPIKLGFRPRRNTANAELSSVARDPSIILLGTVEPRKQQTRVLRIFNEILESNAELSHWSVDVVGSLHPDSSEQLHLELEKSSKIRYRAYCSDGEIDALFSRSRFSVFASTHEGFGLPIIESTYRGVPCMTASFGAMAEVGSQGGCHLVDVRSDDELTTGLLKLMLDETHLSGLAEECRGLPVRTWEDYADNVLDEIALQDLERRAGSDVIDGLLASAASPVTATPVSARIRGIDWQVVWISKLAQSDDVASVDRTNGTTALAVVVDMPVRQLTMSGEHELKAVRSADVLVISDESSAMDLVSWINSQDRTWVAPTAIEVAEAPNDVHCALRRQILKTSLLRSSAIHEAELDSILSSLASTGGSPWHSPRPLLSIIISTYNRGAFVEENVKWLCALVAPYRPDIEIVVVDNSSTDDTTERLQRFIASSEIEYVRNPANVGMLGNLRVCTSLLRGRHVWLTGDDDYILPGALERLLPLLRAYPAVPAVVQNFGVYYRSSFSADDTAAAFCRELVRIAPEPIAAGSWPQRTIGSQHDNLYTAIYPLVLRADLASAMFNFPFDGVPFTDLVECIPTTRYFLRQLQYHELQWIPQEAIAGNAHNSWTKHRPRWHGIIMPTAIQMARDCGYEEGRLRTWLDTQRMLFHEALDIALQQGIPVPIDVDNEFWRSELAFGGPVDLPGNGEFAAAELAVPWRSPRGG